MDIKYQNKRHEQRVATATNLSSDDLEKILAHRKQEDLASFYARKSELQAEIKVLDLKILAARSCLTSFGEEPLKSDMETAALETLKTMVSRRCSPYKAADVARTLHLKRPNYDIETLQVRVQKALGNLAQRGVIKKNEQYKTYTLGTA